jgi:DNA repair protein RadA/Sms
VPGTIAGLILRSKRGFTFICQTCGTAHPRWQGKCEGCGGWNTLA